jgi:hypothetical protein
MNDSREWLYNLDLVRQNLGQRLVQRDGRYGIAFISELTQSPVRHSAANHLGVFIQTSNQLSQWRAYCPSMGGYESCFDFSELKGYLSRHEFQLEECISDMTKQREIVADVIKPDCWRDQCASQRTCGEYSDGRCNFVGYSGSLQLSLPCSSILTFERKRVACFLFNACKRCSHELPP